MLRESGMEPSTPISGPLTNPCPTVTCGADESGKPTGWGEQEMDYILFIRAQVDLKPNPEEVMVSCHGCADIGRVGDGMACAPAQEAEGECLAWSNRVLQFYSGQNAVSMTRVLGDPCLAPSRPRPHNPPCRTRGMSRRPSWQR